MLFPSSNDELIAADAEGGPPVFMEPDPNPPARVQSSPEKSHPHYEEAGEGSGSKAKLKAAYRRPILLCDLEG